MTNDYNMIADILSKFHTSSDVIKAIWLICFTLIPLGIVRIIHDIVKIRTKAKAEPPSEIAD